MNTNEVCQPYPNMPYVLLTISLKAKIFPPVNSTVMSGGEPNK